MHIDALIFYKLFYNSELRSKKLKSILEYFFDNEDIVANREQLIKERDSVSHPNLLVREFCRVLDQQFLINSKKDVHFTRIAPMFFSQDPQQVRELLEYNIVDVFQTARLAATHNIIPQSIAFSTVDEITLNVFYTQSTEIKCMSRIWREIYQAGKIYNVYEFDDDDPYLYSEPHEGALVVEPIPGLYEGIADRRCGQYVSKHDS